MKLTHTLNHLKRKRMKLIDEIDKNIHSRKKLLNLPLREELTKTEIQINICEKLHKNKKRVG